MIISSPPMILVDSLQSTCEYGTSRTPASSVVEAPLIASQKHIPSQSAIPFPRIPAPGSSSLQEHPPAVSLFPPSMLQNISIRTASLLLCFSFAELTLLPTLDCGLQLLHWVSASSAYAPDGFMNPSPRLPAPGA